MTLFLGKRYLGDDGDGTISKQSSSLVLLARLDQKAKGKQKQNLTEERIEIFEKHTGDLYVKKKREANNDSNQESQICKRRKSKAVIMTVSDHTHKGPDECEEKIRKRGANEGRKYDQSVPGCVVDKLSETVTGSDGEVEREDVNIPKETSRKSSIPSGFTVLGGFENTTIQKVHRVLPQWLAQPDVIPRDMKSKLLPCSDIRGLTVPLLKKLCNHGINNFFPVQAEVIPAILEGAQQGLLIGQAGYKPRDICVSSPTGSGKTLAFVIPVIQVLMKRVVCEVRALAVLPTKELAQQVCKVFTAYAEGTTLRVAILAGQKSFAAELASLSEERGGMRRCLADIVVATPGRLVDHINKNSGLSLDHLRFLIIDEADKMIDSMRQSWLSQVVKAAYGTSKQTPEHMSIFNHRAPLYVTATSLSPPQMPLQKLLFSATLTKNPEKLEQLDLHQPRLFRSANPPCSLNCPQSIVDSHKSELFDFPQSLTEFYVLCTLCTKPLIILHFILHMKLSPILCFVNSRVTAYRLYRLMQLFGGIQVAEFSSRLSPKERKKKLKGFEQGKIHLMISTDAAARGIDISGVKCVVNYDAPQYIRTYIHRIGRTARAGKAGLAFTFLLGVQEKNFIQMVMEAGSLGIQKQIINPAKMRSLESRYEQTLQELAAVIKDLHLQENPRGGPKMDAANCIYSALDGNTVTDKSGDTSVHVPAAFISVS
ncbi:ATP-dependent RNA helicase DDX51 isoform X3 [Syngnathoides biaculeatus]|uniref:ATP-dependent RNA helicase DDX51 isoform X3 n=1 Tax=Syngnathoides biaculeatus TaxID=300417 RepID=UPI002ADDF5AC|nr:ATP-dependent RNA helicase DDX51 isoform X3 [Syngnathoides biaculeatus]